MNKNWTNIKQLSTDVGKLLANNNSTLSTAESCTGGGIAYAITEIAGSSAYFTQSWVTYSNLAKINLLNIPESIIEQYGAVSESTVNAMAISALNQAGSDYSIATSGIAGPDGGSNDKPIGLVWFAFGMQGKDTLVEKQIFDGDRESVRIQAIEFALNKLKMVIMPNV
ncbi:CinA family protein [Algibacillus agarilyticus]|uniref:CinA family protein n=1 Tax=Algibacillus agarilyticus TaxID=2234133 RepID=UPI000DD02899|nr:nicotinamide-nucleotide amidohydrolase family protein [Algibacillus agarilyticus]